MGMIGNSLAQGLISGANIQDGTVDTPDIKDSAVTAAKIASAVITPAKLSTGAPTWDSNGNQGVGATLSAWRSGGGVIEINASTNGYVAINGGGGGLLQNAYINSSSAAIYKNTGTALYYTLSSAGEYTWNRAVSGSAGGTITWVPSMTLNASGYLGIGDTTPSFPLEIGASGSTAGAAMLAINPQTSSNASVLYINNAGSGSFYIGRTSSTGAGAADATLTANGASFIWNNGAQPIIFGVSNLTAFTINADQSATFASQVTAPSISLVSPSNGQGNMKFQCTGTPAGTGYAGINAFTNSVFGLGSAGSTNFPVEFYTNGGLAARLTIGRGNQGHRLMTAGTGLSAPGSTYSGGFSAGMTAPSGSNGRNASVMISGNYNSTAGAPQWVSNWQSGGAWGLGPDTGVNDSYVRLGLWGEDADGFYWSGTYINLKVSTLTQTSDYRIKENVRPYEQDALAVLRLFSPKRFNKIVYNDPTIEEPPVVRDEIGYIAHEVQEHIPELVTGVKDAVDAEGNPIIQGMDYDRMGPVLHRALLQLEDKLNAMKAEFDAYKEAHP